jgi:hypothetical protein
MAYATTVYPAKVALKALLAAHTFPSDAPTINWGAPTESEDVTYDAIYLGPTEVPEDQFTTLGHGRTDEDYRITVFVDVYKYGDDEQATEARAWELFNGTLTVLAANPTLSGTVSRMPGFRFRQVNPIPSADIWRSQIQIDIAVVGLVFV